MGRMEQEVKRQNKEADRQEAIQQMREELVREACTPSLLLLALNAIPLR